MTRDALRNILNLYMDDSTDIDYILSCVDKYKSTTRQGEVGKLIDALKHMVTMSDKWGKEWFDKEAWAKVQQAKSLLKEVGT